MALAPISGTKIRGGTYYLNIAIPPAVRHLHEGRALLTGTLKTADPKKAKEGVTTARAGLIKQSQEVEQHGDLKTRLAALTPQQRALYDEAGGLEGLLAAHARTLTAQKFLLAGIPPDTQEDFDAMDSEIAAAEHRAASDVFASIARREAKALRALGEPVKVPGGDASGVAELAEVFTRAKDYTIQNTDSVRYTVRRWIEFHTDLPLAKLTRAHLAEFDEAVRDLPVARQYLKTPMRTAIGAAKRANLERVSQKRYGNV